MKLDNFFNPFSVGDGDNSGKGSTFEFFDVTPVENVTVYGKLVKIGTKVTWTGRASFSSIVSGDKLAFILPENLRPFTKYVFKCGNGGYGYDYDGYILPNGEVHIVFKNSSSIAQGVFSWDVIEPDYQVIVDTTKVTSSSGGIAVIDNMAIMQVSLTLDNFSTGWQNALLTVPSDVPIPSAQCPFCVYRGRNTAQYPDASLGTDGVLDIWLDRSLGTTIDIFCIWEV